MKLDDNDKLNSKIIHENLKRERIERMLDGIWLSCVMISASILMLYLILKVLL